MNIAFDNVKIAISFIRMKADDRFISDISGHILRRYRFHTTRP